MISHLVDIQEWVGKMKSDAASDTHAVTFRHLALLAQLYPNDEDIWESLHRSGMMDTVSIR